MPATSDFDRYARQIVLPEIGTAGQERLQQSRVLVVGAGGLGSPAALYLVAAGVGTVGLLDSDDVELSNLHRQILHGTGDVGKPKVASAAATLARLNPGVAVETMHARLNLELAREIVDSWDVVIDGSDNYTTRYAVNDACVETGKPWVYGSVERYSGQLSVFGLSNGPCYRCVFPAAPSPGSTASCEEIGVLGAVPGVIGSLQALEALKLIVGIGEPMSGRMMQIDFLRGAWRSISFEKRADCAACGATARRPPADQDLADMQPQELQTLLGGEGDVPLLLDVREQWEWNIARLPASRLLPLSQLEAQVTSLNRDADIVVYCHHGTRSAMAAEWLRRQGYRARNLAGGIDRWSREIDSGVQRY